MANGCGRGDRAHRWRAQGFGLALALALATAAGVAVGADPAGRAGGRAPAAGTPGATVWTPLGGGLEHAALATAGIEGHAFRFRPDAVELRVVPAPEGRARVAALALAGDVVALNASFFDEDGRTMGLAVDAGRSVGGRRLARWAAFTVDAGRARIVRGADLGGGVPELAVQGLPRLVVGGAVPRLKPQRARRSAVCVDGRFVVLVATRTSVDASELARLLAAAPEAAGLGCDDALNLDGGGSTQLVARWNGFEAAIDGAWGVPNALVVAPRRD